MILLKNFSSLFTWVFFKSWKQLKEAIFAFESAHLLDYKLHSVRLKRGGSYIKSAKWLENK